MGYACLYKGQGTRVNQIRADELTISIYRDKITHKLIKSLENEGLEVSLIDKGIYVVNGLLNISISLIAISELSEDGLLALKIMVKNASESCVRAFINESVKYINPGDRSDADAVLQVSYEANVEMYRRMRGEDEMCEALKELMAEDLEKERIHGHEEGIKEGISLRDTEKITEMLNDGKTPQEIADFCKYPIEQVKKVYDSLSK